MILADTSAMIDYFRPSGREAVRHRVAEAIAADRVAINGIIRVELLAFAPNEAELDRLRLDLGVLHQISIVEDDFDRAVDLGFSLRRRGFTIPATDLIIASTALRVGATVFHVDHHFDELARYSELKAENLAP